MAGPTGTTISGKPQIILYHRNNLLSAQPNPSRPMTLKSSEIKKDLTLCTKLDFFTHCFFTLCFLREPVKNYLADFVR